MQSDVDSLMRLLLRSLRILRKNWKLTAIAVFSLAIALAVGVVSLGVSNTSLLVPPAGTGPDRLVTIYARTLGRRIDQFSYLDYQFYRQNNHVFTDLAAIPESISGTRSTLSAPGQSGEGRVVTLTQTLASENYFAVLGLRPLLGRLLAPGDNASKSLVTVLTFSGWERIGSDPNIVGKMIGDSTIVGVAPKEFTGSLFGIDGDIVSPLTSYETQGPPDRHELILIGRLKPGVTRAEAQANMTVLAGELAAAYPKEDKDRTAVVTRATLLPPDAIPTTELLVTILLIIVLLVLLIACANVANLLLALAVGRRHEATIKLALGSTRWRLVKEFLGESVILCAVSGVVGYSLAEAAVRRYSKIAVNIPGVGSYSIALKLHLGFTVIAATVALTVIAILATGLPAALYASSPNLSQILSGEIVVGGTRKTAKRNALVIVQVAFCTVVLVGMGLCERSLYNLRHVDPGFTARNLMTETLYPGDLKYSEAQGKALYANVRRDVSALPGVQSAALARGIPLLENDERFPVRLRQDAIPVSAMRNVVDDKYFSTMGIAVLSGRVFGADDTAPSPDLVVINHTLAESLWPGEEATGRTLLTGDPPHIAAVIGVVADGKYGGLDETPQPYIYLAATQHYEPEMMLIARTAGDPRLWIRPLSDAIAKEGFEGALQPITFANVEDLSLFPERAAAAIITGLGALALLLAIVGLFGAISYSVSERKKELGIRVALGAGPWQLLKMIFRQTLVVAGVGVVVGIALGVGATMLLRSQFFGIGDVELSVLLPVAAAMLSVSLAVAYISARPWIKVDPMEAVRHV
jgi:predicted permease